MELLAHGRFSVCRRPHLGGVSAARSMHIAAWCIDDSLDVDVLKTSRGESRLLELWWRERERRFQMSLHTTVVYPQTCVLLYCRLRLASDLLEVELVTLHSLA